MQKDFPRPDLIMSSLYFDNKHIISYSPVLTHEFEGQVVQ